jgi:hypothetical protein
MRRGKEKVKAGSGHVAAPRILPPALIRLTAVLVDIAKNERPPAGTGGGNGEHKNREESSYSQE